MDTVEQKILLRTVHLTQKRINLNLKIILLDYVPTNVRTMFHDFIVDFKKAFIRVYKLLTLNGNDS
jgi:hypothetical protein